MLKSLSFISWNGGPIIHPLQREDSLNGCLEDGWEGRDTTFIHLFTKCLLNIHHAPEIMLKKAVQRHIPARRESSLSRRGEKGGNT